VVEATLAHRSEPLPLEVPATSSGFSIALAGVTDGVGSTEVAVGLARALAPSLSTVVVDLDPVWPSVAPRLDIPLHPNLRTAVDKVLHDSKGMGVAIHRLDELSIVGGAADQGNAGPISHTEIAMLLDVLLSSFEVAIADLGSLRNARGALMGRFDSIALVGSGDPVGLARLLRAIEQVLGMVDEDSLVVVVNKTPQGRYHSTEIRSELMSAYPRIPTVLMPYDRRVTESMWQGSVSRAGRFARSVRQMTGVIEESLLG
jgi:hypothetical protein